MIVTATEIKIKSVIGFFRFIVSVKKIQEQLGNSNGLIFKKYKGFRTLTGWENEEAMREFRNNDHHLNAMKNIKNIGKAKSITWEEKSEPSWDTVIKKLQGVNFNS